MATVNIGNVQDEHYRYKMPRLQAKIEGRGNGIKTNIVNNVEIAKSLARPPLYLLKHFGVELGAQTRFEENTGNSIVNGAHDVKKLCEVLDLFIKAYVQCGECGNPETTIHVKREVISLKCKACGAKTEVDMRHKLNSYIVKNPPPSEKKGKKGDKSSKDKEKEKDKDKKKKKKKEGNDENDGGRDENGNTAEAEPSSSKVEKEKASEKPHDAVEEVDEEEEEEDDDGGVEWKTDTSAAAVKARAQEQLSDVTRDMVTIGNVEAELEARKRKELKRQQEGAAAQQADSSIKEEEHEGAEDDDEEDDEDEDETIIKQLRKLIPSKPAPSIVKALNNLEMEGGMVHKMRVLYEAVFGDLPAGQMSATMAERVELFTLFGGDAKGQAAQMVALEYCVGVSHPNKTSEIPHVLKVMYEEDIVDEEVMKSWYDNPSIAQKLLQVPLATGKVVRKASAVVIEQLVDDDDEDEEEEE